MIGMKKSICFSSRMNLGPKSIGNAGRSAQSHEHPDGNLELTRLSIQQGRKCASVV